MEPPKAQGLISAENVPPPVYRRPKPDASACKYIAIIFMILVWALQISWMYASLAIYYYKGFVQLYGFDVMIISPFTVLSLVKRSILKQVVRKRLNIWRKVPL